jgi:hypothetical protein
MRQIEIRRRMTALVRQWPSSRETQAAFAARHGVARTKLRYWLRRVGSTSAMSTPMDFAPVRMMSPIAERSDAIDIVLNTGERVIVRAGVSPDVLRTVLTVLRATC